jgi:hypothetical protein
MTILQRGARDSSRHVHSYQVTPAIAGFTRRVCSDCQHVSIDSPDAAIPSAAQGRQTGLFRSPPPRLGLHTEELLPGKIQKRRFGAEVRPAWQTR